MLYEFWLEYYSLLQISVLFHVLESYLIDVLWIVDLKCMEVLLFLDLGKIFHLNAVENVYMKFVCLWHLKSAIYWNKYCLIEQHG
jgi:hypothetical protein